jgi:hypothetical protein
MEGAVKSAGGASISWSGPRWWTQVEYIRGYRVVHRFDIEHYKFVAEIREQTLDSHDEDCGQSPTREDERES